MLDLKVERIQWRKSYKDRVTTLPHCNADRSEKIRPLVMGKSEKPCCMKGVKHYLFDYKAPTNAWVAAKIFWE
jgi:hypothetical protein